MRGVHSGPLRFPARFDSLQAVPDRHHHSCGHDRRLRQVQTRYDVLRSGRFPCAWLRSPCPCEQVSSPTLETQNARPAPTARALRRAPGHASPALPVRSSEPSAHVPTAHITRAGRLAFGGDCLDCPVGTFALQNAATCSGATAVFLFPSTAQPDATRPRSLPCRHVQQRPWPLGVHDVQRRHRRTGAWHDSVHDVQGGNSLPRRQPDRVCR